MQISKANQDLNESWLTLRSDGDYCVIHIIGNMKNWKMKGDTLNITVGLPDIDDLVEKI
jgi:hypothetical protein